MNYFIYRLFCFFTLKPLYMKKIYLIISSLFLFFKVFAQDSIPGVNCWANIFCCGTCTGYPFSNVQVDPGISYAKTTTGYPGDITYANEDGDGTCTSSTPGCSTDGSVLFYDVHYPADYANYQTCPLPVVVFVHGGGFSDCSPFTSSSDQCDYFARRGFVCFNISYRIGTRITPDPGYPFITVQQQLATYRAS
jgi:hypothetical protein